MERRAVQASQLQPGSARSLVIQTHGFAESEFRPSGVFPTAFAARALAATGIVVLQVPDEQMCLNTTRYEGPCAVSGYEAARPNLCRNTLRIRKESASSASAEPAST